MHSFSSLVFVFVLFFINLSVGFDPNKKENIVLYWGQASFNPPESLAKYCESNIGDIFVTSFLNTFNDKGEIGMVLAGCDDTYKNGLSKCPQIGEEIKICQKLGKKVFLSLGGAIGNYNIKTEEGGKKLAQVLWNTFGNGQSQTRPFGDAIIDGFDLDIESHNDGKGYVSLVNNLKKLFTSDDSKKYYISAAPQCPYPDAALQRVLDNTEVDLVFVQFYNNYCGVDKPKQFNYRTWEQFALKKKNNPKIFLGIPASPASAGSGYISPKMLEKYVEILKESPVFGGVMMWDALRSYKNIVEEYSYVEHVRNILVAASKKIVNDPKVKTPEPPKAATPEPPKAGTPEPPKAVTPKPPKAATPEPPKAATPESPKAGTPEPPKAGTPEPPKAGTPKPPKAATPEPPKAGTPKPPKAGTPEPPKAGTPEPPKAGTPESPKAGTPESPKAGTPKPPKAATPEPPKAGTPEPPKAGTPKPPKAETPRVTTLEKVPSKQPSPSTPQNTTQVVIPTPSLTGLEVEGDMQCAPDGSFFVYATGRYIHFKCPPGTTCYPGQEKGKKAIYCGHKV